MNITKIGYPIVLIFLMLFGVTELIGVELFNINYGIPLFLMALIGIGLGRDTLKQGHKANSYILFILSGTLVIVSVLMLLT